jgi:hypothetical protein
MSFSEDQSMTSSSSRPAAFTTAASILLAACLSGCAGPGAPPASTTTSAGSADTIYTGGDVVTVDDARPTAEAVAVKDGRIVAVGTRAEVEQAHKGTATRTVDLAGRTLVPGFIVIRRVTISTRCRRPYR